MKQLELYISSIILVAMIFTGCEKVITIDVPDKQKIVVEGHIENNSIGYVILSKSASFFNQEGIGRINDLFIHDAHVTVSEGNNVYELEEYCLNDLPPNIRDVAYQLLGITHAQAVVLDVCAYLNFNLIGEEGKSYSLRIVTDDQVLTSVTTIPSPVSFDSLWTIPDVEYGDSLVVLWSQFNEPDTLGNYYRYWTKANDEPYYPGYFGSVIDDKFGNGTNFKLVLDKGYSRAEGIDFDTYGLFRKGDTIIVKLAMIDKAHYKFWSTLENQLLSGGPFSTPTYIQSNVVGGLGVWGGYGAIYDTLYVPK